MSGLSKKATLLSIHSLFICHYTINPLQNTFDELKFYDSFEELTLTFRKYKSLPRRVFVSSLVSCSSANKVIRNFVRTFPVLEGNYIFVKKIFWRRFSHILKTCSRWSHSHFPTSDRESWDNAYWEERLPWNNDFNFWVLLISVMWCW